MHLEITLRNLLQSCNTKYTVYQTGWLLHPLPFHVLGKVQKQEQKMEFLQTHLLFVKKKYTKFFLSVMNNNNF
jgi:hypothetical protein